jgi:hypothetical protein
MLIQFIYEVKISETAGTVFHIAAQLYQNIKTQTLCFSPLSRSFFPVHRLFNLPDLHKDDKTAHVHIVLGIKFWN